MHKSVPNSGDPRSKFLRAQNFLKLMGGIRIKMRRICVGVARNVPLT